MLDTKFIRENKELVSRSLEARGQKFDLDELLKLEAERRQRIADIERHRQTRNETSDRIARLKRENKPAENLMAEMKRTADLLKTLEEEVRGIEKLLEDRLLRLPNLVHDSVPVGKDEKDNLEVRRWGSPPVFDFKPRTHWEIGEDLGVLDFERAARMTGARFVLYKGLGARMERALINLMVDLHAGAHGYTEVMPPFMVNEKALRVTGQLPKFEEDLFRVGEENLFLVPTAEVPVTNIHQDEILQEDVLPLAYVAYTPCFRREAGSYGKDTRGIIRQHQFNKIELVRFSRPEDSYEQLERLLADAEEVLKRLGLHYRIMLLCSGDIGFSAAKTYDIEVWLPGQGMFKEISSCSNFEAFQARRGDIRFKRKGGKKIEFVHTLNGSGLAVGRTLLAILENYQQKDGSVTVPESLRPYMGGVEKIFR